MRGVLNLNIYKGTLSSAKLRKPEMFIVNKAYASFRAQKSRCENVKDISYSWYGAKGIKIEYTQREFIAWYINEFSKKEYIRPSVGRIDHSKNYSFDNIEIQELSDNCRESMNRTGWEHKKKPIAVFNCKTNELLAICPSVIEAAKLTNVNPMTVTRHVNGHAGKSKRKIRKGFYFVHAEKLK